MRPDVSGSCTVKVSATRGHSAPVARTEQSDVGRIRGNVERNRGDGR